MSVGDFLDWLLKLLGIRDTDEKKYRKLEEKLRAVKATKVDRLEELKDEIGLLEKRAKKKEKEYQHCFQRWINCLPVQKPSATQVSQDFLSTAPLPCKGLVQW